MKMMNRLSMGFTILSMFILFACERLGNNTIYIRLDNDSAEYNITGVFTIIENIKSENFLSQALEPGQTKEIILHVPKDKTWDLRIPSSCGSDYALDNIVWDNGTVNYYILEDMSWLSSGCGFVNMPG